MREVIEQTIDQLSAATGDRKQHSLYLAIVAAVQDSPDDAADLDLFARSPQRYEDLLRNVLEHRLDGDAALLAKLQSLLGLASTPAASRTHTANVSGNARVGSLITGDVNGPVTIGDMQFGDNNSRTISAGGASGTPAEPAARAAPATTAASPAPAPATTAAPRVLDEGLSRDGVHFSYGHALLIGVGDYANVNLSAPATASDARLLAQLLRDPAVAAYPAEQVTLLSGAEATCDNILRALDDFAAQVASTPPSTALLFFAGHGINRDGGYYLLPHDYTRAQLATTAIDSATFRAKVEAIANNAQKMLVLLNCCHSGGVGGGVLSDEEEDAKPQAPPKSFYAPLAEGSGSVVISSSKPAERSGALSNQNDQATVFGAQLLGALGGQAPGQGPAVGVFELFSFLSRSIPADARGITDPFTNQPLEQHPLLYARQVDQDFAVTLRPGKPAGTLGDTASEAIGELAKIEIQLAEFDSEAQAPAELVARRDQLLEEIGG